MYKALFSISLFLALTLNAQSQQTFVNVAPQLGINGIIGVGHSVSWGDIDNDGDPDLGLGDQTWNGYWFFRNDSSSFTDITNTAGIANFYPRSANKTIIAEFTGDEYNDLLIRNMDGLGEYSTLLENNGGSSFTNITTQSMLPDSGVYNVADFNNDGNLDVLSLDILDWGDISLQYGNGDGTFQPLQQIGVLWGYSPLAVFDYDRDGFMDIFWPADAAITHPTTLLKNNGDGTFTDVTASSGIVFNVESATMDIGDINNDGYIDIYIGGKSFNPGKLFLNNGNGTFSDISTASGIFTGQTDSDRTATFGDFDNDGWLDLFLGWKLVPNQLFRNNGDNTFTDVAPLLGLTNPSHGDFFGSGWADYDNDCDLDLFAAGHFDPWVLFENQNCPGNGLFVTLKGTTSNFNAIGARADLWINGQRTSRNLLPDPGIQDFSHMKLHFGMGSATEADSLVVYWPSGHIQTYTDALQLQCNIEIEEDSCGSLAGINGTIIYCDAGPGGDLFNQLGGIPNSGGTWNGPSALAGGDLGIFDPTTDLAGTYMYTVSAGGCPDASSSVVVTLETTPDAGTNGAATYCSTGPGGDLFTELGGTPMGTGTWTPALTSGTGVFDPLADGAGTYTYTVTGTVCANASAADVIVTVNTVDATTNLSGFTITANSTTGTFQWMDCDIPAIIVGETSNAYTATANGNYAVIVTDNGCVDTSACVNIMILGIVENNGFGHDIMIYPNPTGGILSIDLGKNYEAMLVTIHDANGRLIEEQIVSGQIITIDMTEYESGVYVFILSANGKQAGLKVIRE